MCKFIFNCEEVELEKQSLKGDFKAILFNKPGKEELIKVKKNQILLSTTKVNLKMVFSWWLWTYVKQKINCWKLYQVKEYGVWSLNNKECQQKINGQN